MSAVSDMQTLLDAASTAVGTGDWATARTKLLQARFQFAAIPTQTRSEVAYMQWEDRLRELGAALDEAEAAAGRASDRRRMGRMTTGY